MQVVFYIYFKCVAFSKKFHFKLSLNSQNIYTIMLSDYLSCAYLSLLKFNEVVFT